MADRANTTARFKVTTKRGLPPTSIEFDFGHSTKSLAEFTSKSETKGRSKVCFGQLLLYAAVCGTYFVACYSKQRTVGNKQSIISTGTCGRRCNGEWENESMALFCPLGESGGLTGANMRPGIQQVGVHTTEKGITSCTSTDV